MPGRTAGSGTKDGVAEFVQLVIAYAKQETVDPVVKQAKTLGKGVAGAALAGLRDRPAGHRLRAGPADRVGGGTGAVSGWVGYAPLTQKLYLPRGVAVPALTNAYPYGAGAHLSGDWSWVPYMGGALFCLAVAGFCVFRIVKGTGR